mmetsp:Transcript_27025/g.76150  ORF Transcript_27025/g.76150 Transcript_27025/m.76150 type:complete len:151 (+) Transcript_27025:210-662(+)
MDNRDVSFWGLPEQLEFALFLESMRDRSKKLKKKLGFLKRLGRHRSQPEGDEEARQSNVRAQPSECESCDLCQSQPSVFHWPTAEAKTSPTGIPTRTEVTFQRTSSSALKMPRRSVDGPISAGDYELTAAEVRILRRAARRQLADSGLNV